MKRKITATFPDGTKYTKKVNNLDEFALEYSYHTDNETNNIFHSFPEFTKWADANDLQIVLTIDLTTVWISQSMAKRIEWEINGKNNH